VCRAREGSDRSLHLSSIPNTDGIDLYPKRWRHGLDDTELTNSSGDGGIPEDYHTRNGRRDVLEQLQPFRTDPKFEEQKPSDISTRSRKAVDKSSSDRINGNREHDGNRACDL